VVPAGTSVPTTKVVMSSPAAAPRNRFTSSALMIAAVAPESVSTCRSSGSVCRKITGVTTAPARQIARYETNTSGVFIIITTTRSPGATPCARRPPAVRADRSWISPEVDHLPSKNSDS
jgi:hypothetical protein